MNSLVLERPAFISLGLFKCLALPPPLPQMPSPREGASIDFFCLAFTLRQLVTRNLCNNLARWVWPVHVSVEQTEAWSKEVVCSESQQGGGRQGPALGLDPARVAGSQQWKLLNLSGEVPKKDTCQPPPGT